MFRHARDRDMTWVAGYYASGYWVPGRWNFVRARYYDRARYHRDWDDHRYYDRDRDHRDWDRHRDRDDHDHDHFRR